MAKRDICGDIKSVGNASLGLATGGLAGNEKFGILDDAIRGAGDYFMADTRAAREQQSAARLAQGYVQQYGDQALGTMSEFAVPGIDDYNNYRGAVNSGQFSTDPGQFQTGGYQQGQYGQGAPGFQQFQQRQAPGYQGFQQRQAPGYQAFQQGQAPTFGEFSRQQGPEFERADAGQFNFDYEKSPGFDFQMQQGLASIGSNASAKGARFGAGRDKQSMEFASGLAAQDYGSQYNRARGAFQDDRSFGAGQSAGANVFNQGGYQYGQSLDANQQNIANQYGQNTYQFDQNMGFQGNANMNQYGQNAYQFGQNMGNQNNMMAQNMNNSNYWAGQNMNQNERQFGYNANLGANAQNYDMYNQQGVQNSNLMRGLSDQGYNSNINLANMQQGMGDSMANAALGVGNANANRAMSTQNSVNNTVNTVAQLGGAYKAVKG